MILFYITCFVAGILSYRLFFPRSAENAFWSGKVLISENELRLHKDPDYWEEAYREKNWSTGEIKIYNKFRHHIMSQFVPSINQEMQKKKAQVDWMMLKDRINNSIFKERAPNYSGEVDKDFESAQKIFAPVD